jgi:hypothetical protein
VVVPPDEIRRRELGRQGVREVGSGGRALEGEVDSSPDRESNELGAHALLCGSDALQIACAPIVELDEDVFHMEFNVLALGRGSMT